MRKHEMRQFAALFLFIALIAGTLVLPSPSYAAPAYNQTSGTYTDDFANSSGISATSSTRLHTDGTIRLTNSTGTVAAPYATSGYMITATIIPTSVAAWGNITFVATTTASTSVKVQVLDEGGNAYPNSLLSGNEAGFTASSVDISSLPIDRLAVNDTGKFARIKLKFTLTSSNTAETPVLDNIGLTWTTRQGSTASTTIADTAWPSADGGAFARRHVSSTPDSPYRVLRWAKDLGINYGGSIIRGTGETIYNKTQGGTNNGTTFTEGKIMALNRNTGTSTWERTLSGNSYTVSSLTLGANGDIYTADIYHDIVVAYDSTGTPKWTYQFTSGHGSGAAMVGADGTVYVVRADAGDDSFDVYAFSADGTVRWNVNKNPAGTIGVSHVTLSPDSSVIYVGTNSTSAAGSGRLYAFDATTGADEWDYLTGDISTPAIGPDGTIYTANSNSSSYRKRVTALNSDGTLKWERSIGTSTNFWIKNSLASNMLLLERVNSVFTDTGGVIEAVNLDTGALLWSLTMVAQADVLNGGLSSDATGFLIHPSVYGVSTTLQYYDYDRNLKWAWDLSTASKNFDNFTTQDEDGNIYANLFDQATYESDLLGFAPWTIGVTTSGTVAHGGTLTITATTTMPGTDPWSGSVNKMQAVMADGTKVAMSNTASAGGVYTWTGTYTNPAGTANGSHAFTIEAAAVGTRTDQTTNFASAPAGSNNTGRSVAAAYDSYDVTLGNSVPVTVSGFGYAPPASSPSQPAPSSPPASTSTAGGTSGSSGPGTGGEGKGSDVVQSVLDMNIPRGTRSPAILLLQRYLNLKGFTVAISGPGAPGQETDYYGPATVAALEKYLEKAASGAYPPKFTKNLRRGMTDPDVRMLQQFLNAKGFIVAVSGPGSVGLETDFYGAGTAAVVKAFQEKYAKEILQPLGLSAGTGVFGEATRNFANGLQ